MQLLARGSERAEELRVGFSSVSRLLGAEVLAVQGPPHRPEGVNRSHELALQHGEPGLRPRSALQPVDHALQRAEMAQEVRSAHRLPHGALSRADFLRQRFDGELSQLHQNLFTASLSCLMASVFCFLMTSMSGCFSAARGIISRSPLRCPPGARAESAPWRQSGL